MKGGRERKERHDTYLVTSLHLFPVTNLQLVLHVRDDLGHLVRELVVL